MLDYIRNNHKIVLILLIFFILPGFFLFGLEGFTRMGDKSETVAVVGGQKIGQLEWDRAVQEDVERIRQNAPNVDPKLFDSSEFKYNSLERLVRQRVLVIAAQKLHLEVSDQRLATELLQNPVLASLRKADGKIDEARYKELLAPQGLTPQGFEAKVRSDLAIQQVLANLVKSSIVPQSFANVALDAYFEKRDIQILNFIPTTYMQQIKPTDAELESFYKANAVLFQATEKADVEYVVLDIESLKQTIITTEADIKKFYEENASKLSGAEERKASHILIASPKAASSADRAKAKKQAEELLANVKKSPATFAEAAKKNSQDSASAVNGGDLGFFARGSMVKSFEDAAFALQPKQISDVVESDFGYHIIQLQEIKAPKAKSYSEMRSEIEIELKKQLAQKKFAEIAETFTNTVYEQSDSLKPVVDKLKLEIKTAQNVTRQAGPENRGPLANSKFLTALFASDSIDKKRNTQAIELGGSQLVAGRISQYSPAQTRPFADVKEKALALLTQRMGSDLARKEGAENLAKLQSNPDAAPNGLGASLQVSRDASQQQNLKLVDAVLRANSGKLPAWIGVDLGDEGYRVVRVNKAIEGKSPAAAQGSDQYLQLWSTAEGMSYYEALKEKFGVEIKVSKPTTKAKSG